MTVLRDMVQKKKIFLINQVSEIPPKMTVSEANLFIGILGNDHFFRSKMIDYH